MPDQQYSPRPVAAPLTAIVALLLSVAFVAAVLIGLAYRRELDAVRASVETQRALTRLLSGVQDAETGQRGFLLTGDLAYLSPYERATRELPRRFAALRDDVGNDLEQQARLDTLGRDVAAKRRELARTVALEQAGRHAAALALVRTNRGSDTMRAIRATVATIDAVSATEQRAREEAATRRGWLLVALMVLPLLAIPLLLLRASRDMRAFFAQASQRLERRRVEAERLGETIALREAELSGVNDQFSLVLDAATDYAIILIDPEGVVLRWSRGAEHVFGWPATEIVGAPADLIFVPEDRDAGVPGREMQMARDAGRAGDERWHLRADGTRFWASGEMQPLRAAGRNDAPLGFLKIVRDRTEERLAREAERSRGEMLAARVDAQALELQTAEVRHQEQIERRTEAEGQLRQLQKLEGLGQLTAGIAHDFNNMLAVVIGALDLLKRKFASENPAMLRLVSAAEEGAGRASELTKRLLAFSRQQPLAPQVINLNRLVAGMSEILRRTLGEQVQIETVLAGGLWNVNADPHEIERVLVNLAVNARDAMPEGGKLTIETGNAHLDDHYARAHADVTAGQYAMISVTDTGTGMAADVLAKAFDPFFSTKRVGEGTGLGLSQLYGFAKQSSGHAKIYSEVGHGTTVKLYLPRWRGQERPASPRPITPEVGELPHGNTNELILVVEDEERVRLISVEALRDLGYTVRHASTGAEALRLMDEVPGLTLLFTDIVMPGMTGRQLADAAAEKQPQVKVLYTTGYTRNAVVHGGVLDPGVAFLPKPFSVEQLALKVRATIDGEGANR